jgi:subtilisin family serine protease
MNRRLILSIAAVLALGACSDQQDPSQTETPSVALNKATASYVIGFSAAEAGDLKAAIQRAGGKANFISNRAGLATAESADPSFAGKLGTVRGVRGVAMDTVVQWVDPRESPQGASIVTGDDTRFAEQWSLKAIEAKRAWDENGARGTGARVAVLDGGLNHNHEDLAGVVRVDLSRSFIPSTTPNFEFDKDVPCPAAPCFSHATHVAGIIAAKDNDRGTIGVAPGAEIVGVKVLHGGSGSFAWIISGIVYAASPENAPQTGGANADIINMSLGAQLPSSRDSKVRALKAFLDQATTYAHNEGTLVLAAAGNGDRQGRGIDHDLGRWFTLPAQAENVVGVSALGPVGFALGEDNFDRLASYSNFGVRLVDLSGPGGDFVLPPGTTCTVVVTRPCWFFDQVLSPASLGTNETYFWAAGTSMSTPAVAGVAALVIGTNGHLAPEGPQRADALFDRLVLTSDDLGKTGLDPVYGKGRVNAYRATQ